MDEKQQAILDLQQMLNQLGRRHPAIPRLMENGVFDENTLEAVMVFQRDFFPPVTGVVDETTWYAIVDAYRQDQLRYGDPTELRVLPDGNFVSPLGQSSYPMLIVQAIFASLPATIKNFTRGQMNGSNTGASHENLRILQGLAGLPVHGTLDRATWEFLARLYHAFVTRSALDAFA